MLDHNTRVKAIEANEKDEFTGKQIMTKFNAAKM
jgi:hypothetical protein